MHSKIAANGGIMLQVLFLEMGMSNISTLVNLRRLLRRCGQARGVVTVVVSMTTTNNNEQQQQTVISITTSSSLCDD